ncbi:MAG: hypothetical protein F9K36_11770 [Burkholderiaceae bacterium]|nr:MAG: hypothetical protein F9K36_11770 [Burkholderiaceae bacterium]
MRALLRRLFDELRVLLADDGRRIKSSDRSDRQTHHIGGPPQQQASAATLIRTELCRTLVVIARWQKYRQMAEVLPDGRKLCPSG